MQVKTFEYVCVEATMKKMTQNHKHKKHNSKEGYNLTLPQAFGGVEFASTKKNPWVFLLLIIYTHVHLLIDGSTHNNKTI
jgi:hypothetical protein